MARRAIHVKRERNERRHEAKSHRRHQNRRHNCPLLQPQSQTDMHERAQTPPKKTRNTMPEHKAPSSGDPKRTQQIRLALTVDQVVIEFVNRLRAPVEHVARVIVRAGDIDLARGGGEGGDGDEKEDGGERCAEVEDETRIGEETQDGGGSVGGDSGRGEVGDELGFDTS
ncbi:hypothetical protein C0989_003385 [Termitomyces sp. Mn162]|nr:hypothetical protein C0989_003385 [Termitomyces sp. Mn162]